MVLIFLLDDVIIFKGETPESGSAERSVLQLLAAWHPRGEGGQDGQQHHQPDGGGEGEGGDGQEHQSLPHYKACAQNFKAENKALTDFGNTLFLCTIGDTAALVCYCDIDILFVI